MPDLLGGMGLDIVGPPGASAAIRRAPQALSDHGVGEGDLILYQAPQMALALPLFWAAVALEAVVVPIDAGWPDGLVEKGAGRLRPRFMAALPDRLLFPQRLFPASVSLALDEAARCEALFPWHGRPARRGMADQEPPADERLSRRSRAHRGALRRRVAAHR